MKNNKNIIRAMAFGVLLVAGVGASAGESYYGGNLTFIDYSETGFEDASLSVLSGRLGTSWNDNFSGELRLGFGVGDDTIRAYGMDVDLAIKNFYGAYIKSGVQMTDTIYPYAILGYTRGEAEVSIGSLSESTSETDVSFGIGTDFNISESLNVNLEYMNYLDKDGADISGFSLGFSSKF